MFKNNTSIYIFMYIRTLLIGGIAALMTGCSTFRTPGEWTVDGKGKVSVYFVPNTHIPKDIERDNALIVELANHKTIDSAIMECFYINQNNSPVPFELLERYMGTDFAKAIAKIPVYGCQDIELRQAIDDKEHMLIASQFFKDYCSGMFLAEAIEKQFAKNGEKERLGFPNDKYNYEKLKKELAPLYAEVCKIVEPTLKMKITPEVAQRFAQVAPKDFEQAMKEHTEKTILVLRDKVLMITLDTLVQNGHEDIAVLYGEDHMPNQTRLAKEKGYRVLVAQQEPITKEEVLGAYAQDKVQTPKPSRILVNDLVQCKLIVHDYVAEFMTRVAAAPKSE